MIKLENTETYGWEAAIRGMRNPMNSWDRSDSTRGCDGRVCDRCDDMGCNGEISRRFIGPNDHDLMMRLATAGPVHAKYRRMIGVSVDITAPLYWWKEFDTYKVGTVANSCSTMHKIHSKPFGVDDFSMDELFKGNYENEMYSIYKPHYKHFTLIIDSLNNLRDLYLKSNDKRFWRLMIEMLPSSYNQKRTVMLNYEVLANIYISRKDHKLDEWHTFCDWIESLPYSELITGEENND